MEVTKSQLLLFSGGSGREEATGTTTNFLTSELRSSSAGAALRSCWQSFQIIFLLIQLSLY